MLLTTQQTPLKERKEKKLVTFVHRLFFGTDEIMCVFEEHKNVESDSNLNVPVDVHDGSRKENFSL